MSSNYATSNATIKVIWVVLLIAGILCTAAVAGATECYRARKVVIHEIMPPTGHNFDLTHKNIFGVAKRTESFVMKSGNIADVRIYDGNECKIFHRNPNANMKLVYADLIESNTFNPVVYLANIGDCSTGYLFGDSSQLALNYSKTGPETIINLSLFNAAESLEINLPILAGDHMVFPLPSEFPDSVRWFHLALDNGPDSYCR